MPNRRISMIATATLLGHAARRRSLHVLSWIARKAGLAALPMMLVTALPAQAQEAVTLWHSMGGRNGEALNALVEEFNAANAGKIKVTAVFQGPYADALAKVKSAIQSRQLPELVQVNEIGSRLIYDLKITVPFGDIAKSAGLDTNDLLKGIAAYYTVDGKLLALPFNASAPMLYYNKTAFKEAGLDPEKPPRTLQELRAAAEKLVVKQGDRTTRYGFVAVIDGWLMEQFYGRANLDFCNQGNGRNGLATAVNWNVPAVREIVDWWGSIMRDGVGLSAGRQNNDGIAAFTSGRAAMLIFTSANMRDMMRESKFDVGVAPYPSPKAGMDGQVLNGGAAIWVIKGQSAAKQNAAARFLAFLGSPGAQATWATRTGYIPVNARAVELPAFKEAVAKNPEFALPGRALSGVASTPASRGCFMGVMPQARQKMNDIIEAVILGRDTAPHALAEGQTAMEGAIKAYNRAIGR
jgi:sn-glycerol 3-phosphate transport system substrate-binding protein